MQKYKILTERCSSYMKYSEKIHDVFVFHISKDNDISLQTLEHSQIQHANRTKNILQDRAGVLYYRRDKCYIFPDILFWFF